MSGEVIRALSEADLDVASAIHKMSFETGWDAATLGEYLTPKSVALGLFEGVVLQGFILLGAVSDQTDMITLAVNPDFRGRGAGRQLVKAAEKDAASRGAELIFLEVAEDNVAATALYRSCRYVPIGMRKNYYKRKGGRVSALTMRNYLGTDLQSTS